MEKETKIIRTSLRIPTALYERLEASAKERGMTMHADILSRLERSFADDEFLPKYVVRHEELKRSQFENEKILSKLGMTEEDAKTLVLTILETMDRLKSKD